MAEKTPKGSDGRFAERIDPSKDQLSKEQLNFIRQAELERWKKKTHKLTKRNAWTALAIGAVAVGILDLSTDEVVRMLTDEYLSLPQDSCLPQYSRVLDLSDGYTFYAVSQERIMDELDEEATRTRLQVPKTGAN